MDRYEYLNNRQRCIRFKHRMFFIIMYSKEKNIVSKKTFILESIGYAIFLLSIIAIIISLKLNVKIALLLLGIVAFAVLVYAWIVADMDYKVENGKRK